MKDDGGAHFRSLPRKQQLVVLVRRFKKIRREAKQILIDRESFNDILAGRGEPPIEFNPYDVRVIAWRDQCLEALKRDEPLTLGPPMLDD